MPGRSDYPHTPDGRYFVVRGRLWRTSDPHLDPETGRDGIARVLYVTAIGRRVIVVRAFVKKTQKTPRGEIELALQRAKEIA